MAHNSTANTGTGGDTFFTVDVSLGTYPTTGKAPGNVLLVSANSTTAPTPVTAANGLYVQPGTSTTWAISAASLPLPSGAATSAAQTTGNASLTSIDGKLPALGQALAAASVPVVLTAAQILTLTPLAPVAATQSGPWTVDTELPAAATISSENTAAPSAPSVYAFGMVYDGANWDRLPGTSVDGILVNLGGNNDVDTELPAAAALADAAANPTAPAVGSSTLIFNGTTWDRARGDTTNGIDVDVTRLPALVAGTANIGDVDVLTIAAGDNNIGNVDIVTMPNVTLGAGTALIGKTSASLETSTIYDGTTALTPKYAAIAAASSGNNTLVSAVNPKKIRVLAYNFIANGTVNAKFQSGASGTDLTGLKYCVANSGLCAPFNPLGWFETASNTLLNLNLSGATAVGGELVYVEVS